MGFVANSSAPYSKTLVLSVSSSARTIILSDSHERVVPTVLEWELTECDINKDVKVNGSFHITGLKIQVKHMNHLFSIYIKSMGKDTIYRIEERKHPHEPAVDFINDVFNPMEKFEKIVSEFRRE